MTKRLAVYGCILLILGAALLVPVTRTRTFEISATFRNTVGTLMHPSLWNDWYPGLGGHGASQPSADTFTGGGKPKIFTLGVAPDTIRVHEINPSAYEVREAASGRRFSFSIYPGTTPGTMTVNLVNRSPLLFAEFRKELPGEAAITALKSYLENVRSFYGYDILATKIRDSIIASIVLRIPKKDLFPAIHEGFRELQEYLAAKDLARTGHVSVSYIPLSPDSLRVTVGIPVNQFATPAHGVACLLLPGKGNILVGTYQGLFSGRQNIYNAMARYEADHSMMAPSEPFERYLNDSLPDSDSSRIMMELNYPVY